MGHVVMAVTLALTAATALELEDADTDADVPEDVEASYGGS
jgi:hypothetical protein